MFQRLEHYIEPEINRLRTMDFAQRLDYERTHFERLGIFPFYSIMMSSLFSHPVKRDLELFKAKDVFPVSVHKTLDFNQLVPRLADFIGTPCPDSIGELPRLFNLSNAMEFTDASYEDPAVRKKFGDYLDKDIRVLARMLEKHGCDMTFFKGQHLMTN